MCLYNMVIYSNIPLIVPRVNVQPVVIDTQMPAARNFIKISLARNTDLNKK